MANIIKSLTRDDPKREGGEPCGPSERFYLGRSLRNVQLNKAQSIPIGINGFYRYADMGEDNEMEKEFVDVLEQCASTVMVPDVDERHPRSQNQPAAMRVEYLGDFEMRRENKKVADVRNREMINVPGGHHKRTKVSGTKKWTPQENWTTQDGQTITATPVSAPNVSGEAQKEE